VAELFCILLVNHPLEMAVSSDEIPKAAVVPVGFVVPIHAIDDGKQTDALNRDAHVVGAP
jgi:hypothetical protein